jgi:thiamine kinase-like enzyme
MSIILSGFNIEEYLVSKLNFTKDEVCGCQIHYHSPKGGNSFIYFTIKLNNGKKLIMKQVNSYYDHSVADMQIESEVDLLDYLRNNDSLAFFDCLIPEHTYASTDSALIYQVSSSFGDLKYLFSFDKNHFESATIELSKNLAALHAQTSSSKFFCDFQHKKAHDFLVPRCFSEDITFEILIDDLVPQGYTLISAYQSDPDIKKYIKKALSDYQPYCLCHNNLNFSNVYFHNSEDHDSGKYHLKIVDWHHHNLGDPAFDLAQIIGEYLMIWLDSMIFNPSVDLDVSLRTARIPLESIKPSMESFMKTYIVQNPVMLSVFPDFINKVMCFTGFVLLCRILEKVQSNQYSNNQGICVFRIAKNLMLNPNASGKSILGNL